MKNRIRQYRGVLFLKNKEDINTLKSGTALYGKVIETTRTILITPYAPCVAIIKMIGAIESKQNWNLKTSLPIKVHYSSGKLHGKACFNGQSYEFPIDIIDLPALYARTPFKQTEQQHLQRRRVLLFGAGTGGSKIALELARAGVNITLCDPDHLEWANVSRHEGDLTDVGKFKVHLIAERIYWINPSIEVTCYVEDIFERDIEFIESLFVGHDLVMADTDVTAVQLTINEFAHRLKIPCVFGGCYEEARGGEVLFTLPGEKTPCLACLRSGLKQPETKGNIDYSTAVGPEDYQGQPGLHAMVDFVTCPEIIISLAILLRSIPGSQLGSLIDPQNNFLLVGGALGTGFYRFKKPFDIFFQPLSGPRKNCPVCGTDRKKC